MSANVGTIAGRRPFQVPAWAVIAVTALVVGTLAVVVTPENAGGPSTTAEAVEGTTVTHTDLAEMAALKAAIGREWAAERFADSLTPNPDTTDLGEAAEITGLKAAIGLRGTDTVWRSTSSQPVSDSAEIAALKAGMALECSRRRPCPG